MDAAVLPSIDLTSALDHVADTAARCDGPGSRLWWQALHVALADPGQLTPEQQAVLPTDLVAALQAGTDDDIVEAWLDDPTINDHMWTCAVHCPHDCEIVAHLVLAASMGAPAPIAELLCRDLVRMATVDQWDDPIGAAERIDRTQRLAAQLGVHMTPFRDLYDVMTSGSPAMTVARVVRSGAAAVGRSIAVALGATRPGDLLVIDAGDLYDRHVLRVDSCDRAVEGVEMVSGVRCRLEPVSSSWVMTARFA